MAEVYTNDSVIIGHIRTVDYVRPDMIEYSICSGKVVRSPISDSRMTIEIHHARKFPCDNPPEIQIIPCEGIYLIARFSSIPQFAYPVYHPDGMIIQVELLVEGMHESYEEAAAALMQQKMENVR